MADMDMKGMNFTGTGALMNQEEMIAMRKKKGQCVTCGRQTHVKKMFKMIPMTIVNEVQDGRCLKCRPLSDRLNSSMSGGVSTSGVGSSKISRSVGSSTREAQAAAAFYEQFNAQLGSNAPNPVVMCSNGQMMTVTSPPPPNGHDHTNMEQYPVGGPSPSPPRAGKSNTRFKTVTKQLMNINRISGAIGHHQQQQQHQPQDNNHHNHHPSSQYHYSNDNDDRSVYSTQSYDQTRSNRGGSHRDRGSSRYIVESNQSLVSHTSGRSSAGGGGGGRHFVQASSPPPHHHPYQSSQSQAQAQAQQQRPLSPRSQMREMKLRRDYSRRRASLDDPYDQQQDIAVDHEPQYFRQGSGSGSGTNIHSSSSFQQQQQRHNSDRDRRRRSADAERVFDDGSPISQHGSNRSIPSRQDSGRSQRSERSSSGQSSLGQPRHHQSMYVDSGNTGTRGASPSSFIDQQQQQQHKSMDLRGFLDRGGVIDSERFSSGGGGTRSMVGGSGGGNDSYRRNLRGNGTTHNRFLPQQQQPQSISSSQSYTGHYVGGGSGNNNGSDRSLRSNPTPSSTASAVVASSSQLRSSPSRKLSQIQSSGSIHGMGTSKSFDDTTPPLRGRDYNDNRSRESSYNYNDASFKANHHSEFSHRKLPAASSTSVVSTTSSDHNLHGRYIASRSSDNHNHVLEQSMNLDEITGTGVGNNNNTTSGGNTTPTSLSISQAMKVISNTNNPLDVLDLMREFATISRDIQVEGCHFFTNVVDPSSSNVRSAFYQLGGCDCVVTAMRLYPHDESLQKEACSVMEVYSRYCAGDLSSSLKMLTMDNPSNISNSSAVDAATEQPSLTFVQFGAVEWVAKAMKQFSQNVKLQTPAMAALANFSSSELLRSDIQECQCIPTIVSVMTTHCLDDQLQEVATACLANLSSSDSSFKKIISSSGGIDAICIAMVMHPNSVKLQQVGCRALRFLSASNEENKTKIESAGGIDSILSAMLIHQTLAGVVVEGLWALSNLAINKHNKVVIGESNGVEVIVKTMWAHGTVADVQELACRTLWTLSVNADNKSRVANQGGIKAIVNAMQTHSDHAGVQQNGCGCLANLAANSDNNKRLIVEGEGVDAVVMAMMLHGTDKVVQERAVNCVRKLAFEPHLEALRAAGVAALVEQAAQAFPSQCRAKADQVLGIL